MGLCFKGVMNYTLYPRTHVLSCTPLLCNFFVQNTLQLQSSCLVIHIAIVEKRFAMSVKLED